MKLRMIIDQATKDERSRRKMIEEIRQKIVGGAEFAIWRGCIPKIRTQENDGDWGWIRRNLNESLTKALFSMKPGQVSQVIDLGDSYFLLAVEAKKPADDQAAQGSARRDREEALAGGTAEGAAGLAGEAAQEGVHQDVLSGRKRAAGDRHHVGDAAGIGPEIVAAALRFGEARRDVRLSSARRDAARVAGEPTPDTARDRAGSAGRVRANCYARARWRLSSPGRFTRRACRPSGLSFPDRRSFSPRARASKISRCASRAVR